MAIVAMKVFMLRSKRVATRRQSLKRQNMRSTTLRIQHASSLEADESHPGANVNPVYGSGP